MKTTSRRSGFTLVEILIVLGIIVAVAAIFVPVALNLTERNQVPKGASLLENALSIAKARAAAERRPNGVRLIAAANQLRTTAGGAAFAWYDQIQYIESPYDYSEHWVWGVASATQIVSQPFWTTGIPIPGNAATGIDTVAIAAGPYAFPVNSLITDSNGSTNTAVVNIGRDFCLFGPISTPTPTDNWVTSDGLRNHPSQRFQYSPNVTSPFSYQPGDKLELTGVGEVFTILAVSINNIDISVAPSQRVFVPVIILDRALPNDVSASLNGRANYRIMRQPRVITSLQPVKLPQDVVVDLTRTRQGVPLDDRDTNGNFFMSGVSAGIDITPIAGINPVAVAGDIAPPYVDILFSPSGEIIPTGQRFRSGTSVGGFSVGASGLIAIWLHQRGDPNLWAARQATAAQGNADNQALVTVNARSGFIGSYPMTPLSISADPLQYARLGKARISADTGQ